MRSTPPFREAFLLLQTIPGIGQLAAASILAEIGSDNRPFCSGMMQLRVVPLCV
jgi:transposase